jgi:hypothetical protein
MDAKTLAECQEAYARGYEAAQKEFAKTTRDHVRTINALADAVELSGDWFEGDWHSSGCGWWNVQTTPCGEHCAQRREALRLAGRLP